MASELRSIGRDSDRESRRGDRPRKRNANNPLVAPTAPVALPHRVCAQRVPRLPCSAADLRCSGPAGRPERTRPRRGHHRSAPRASLSADVRTTPARTSASSTASVSLHARFASGCSSRCRPQLGPRGSSPAEVSIKTSEARALWVRAVAVLACSGPVLRGRSRSTLNLAVMRGCAGRRARDPRSRGRWPSCGSSGRVGAGPA
jgi:hypothetical protein